MKTTWKCNSCRRLAQALLVAATTLLAGSNLQAGSPVGSWDLLSGGAGQAGLAVLTFSNDFTFSGYQLLPGRITGDGDNNEIGRDSDTDRTGSSGSGSTVTTRRALFGFSRISGIWSFNERGRVVGFYSQVINVTSVATNFLPYFTNEFVNATPDGGIGNTTNIFISYATGQGSTNITLTWESPTPFSKEYTFLNPNFGIAVVSAEGTNSVNFVGIARTGQSLYLAASTSNGKVVFNGKPLRQLRDLSGFWIGRKVQKNQSYNEFFTLQHGSILNPEPVDWADVGDYPNIYFTDDGLGSAYTFEGVAFLSRHGKIGFTMLESVDGMRSTAGNFFRSNGHNAARTRGVMAPLDHVTFNAVQQ